MSSGNLPSVQPEMALFPMRGVLPSALSLRVEDRQRRINPRVSSCDLRGGPKVKGGSPSAVSSGPNGLKVKGEKQTFPKSFSSNPFGPELKAEGLVPRASNLRLCTPR